MAVDFKYVEHPHIAEREADGPVTTRKIIKKVAADSPAKRFNSKLGLGITLSSAPCGPRTSSPLFALVSLYAALSSGNLITIVAWIAQTFLQLVLLPIIIVGQNIQATASDARSPRPTRMPPRFSWSPADRDAPRGPGRGTSARLDKVAALEAALLKK